MKSDSTIMFLTYAAAGITSTLISLAWASGAIASTVVVPPGILLEQSDQVPMAPSNETSIYTATPIGRCLSTLQADAIVNAFNWLLANPKAPNFVATANALFSSDVIDTSDSINQLAGFPLESVTFANRAEFVAGSSSQPPLILETLDVFSSCNAISWRWVSVSGAGNDQMKVKGIDNFYINSQGQIKSVYAEFNSGAWLADLGYPECKKS